MKIWNSIEKNRKDYIVFSWGPSRAWSIFWQTVRLAALWWGRWWGLRGERGLRILRCFLSHVNTTFWVVSFRCPPSNWQINRGFSLNGSTMSTLYSSSVWGNDKHPALQASRALWALTIHIWVFCGIQPSSPTHLFHSEPCSIRSECSCCGCDHFTLQVSPEKFCSERGMSLSLYELQSPMSCHKRILFFSYTET